ncbi:probable G-protein coupled receptor 34b [Stegostoma tigrinum]|uniref:probable G-protein coupled receptor 34b n=1 Tax=Stegostoma tigrinum TaxID=3053191 RepID=UPI00202B9C11|nr:probable G-protein coupled receptor 34b [Stegostoma tigrinum]XP_048397455.1 probable G-protein coupled receptor 34b [Stegostoma tigrinum]
MGTTNLSMRDWRSENGSKLLKAKMEMDVLADQNCTIHDNFLMTLLPVAYSLIFLIGLISNISALCIFFFIQDKKNSIHIYLINMAIADLFSISSLPFRIAYHANHNQWMLGTLLCNIIGNVFYMTMYISIILLGLISVDRYLKITRPLRHYKIRNATQSAMICAAIWFVSILITIPMLLKTKGDNNSNNNLKCFHYRGRDQFKTYINIFIVMMFWVVFFCLTLSYGKIAKKLFTLSREKPGFSNSKVHSKIATKTFVVLFIFTVCFIPYHISRFFYIASQLRETSCYWKNVVNKTNEISLLLSAFNSCLDPIMYFLLSKTVRKTVQNLVCEKLQKDTRSEST